MGDFWSGFFGGLLQGFIGLWKKCFTDAVCEESVVADDFEEFIVDVPDKAQDECLGFKLNRFVLSCLMAEESVGDGCVTVMQDSGE